MATTLSDGLPTLSEYQLRLPTYEGPLDVLLRLIERSQLAIEDVSLVAVTHQFLAFVEGLVEASPDVVAEFTAVGARLTVLKSRSLLPRVPATEDETPESDLSQQLREYKRIKQLAEHLQDTQAAGAVAYSSVVRGAVKLPTGLATVRLAQQDASSLLRSLRRRLSAVPRPATIVRQRRIVSLRDSVAHVSTCVDRLACVPFSTVVEEYRSRTEVATAFLAVLVLVRRQAIAASQGDVFGDIALSRGHQTMVSNGTGGTGEHDDESEFRYAGKTD